MLQILVKKFLNKKSEKWYDFNPLFIKTSFMKKIFDFCVKYMILCFVFLLPFHAVIITILQCKLDIPTGILRFWKEWVILLLLAIVSIKLLLKHKSNIGVLLKNNSLVGLIIVFIFSSLLYTFYPYLTIKTHAILGFKYDVFFLFTLLIGLYLFEIRHYFKTILIENLRYKLKITKFIISNNV